MFYKHQPAMIDDGFQLQLRSCDTIVNDDWEYMTLVLVPEFIWWMMISHHQFFAGLQGEELMVYSIIISII